MNKSEQILALQTEIDTLKKELEASKAREVSATSNQNTWYKLYNDVNRELEQLHTLLDILPGSIPQLNDDGYTKRSVLLRLSAWLSIRN